MSIRQRCLLFRIILKSVSSSLVPTSTTFLILVISHDLHFFYFCLSFFPSFTRVSRHSGIRKTENGNIHICMDAAKSRVNQSSLAKRTSARFALDAAKNNGRCMSGPA